MKIDDTLLTILIKDIAIPEVLAFLHRSTPDEGQIFIILSKDTAQIKAVGQAFLDRTAA